jgi:hypothetical protein
MMDVFRRYISKSDLQVLVAANEVVVEAAAESQPNSAPPVGLRNGMLSRDKCKMLRCDPNVFFFSAFMRRFLMFC